MINISAPTAGRKSVFALLTASAGDAAEKSARSGNCRMAALTAKMKIFISIQSPVQGYIKSL